MFNHVGNSYGLPLTQIPLGKAAMRGANAPSGAAAVAAGLPAFMEGWSFPPGCLGPTKHVTVVNVASEDGGDVVAMIYDRTMPRSGGSEGQPQPVPEQPSTLLPAPLQAQLLSAFIPKENDSIERTVFLSLARKVAISMLQSLPVSRNPALDLDTITKFCTETKDASVSSNTLIFPQCAVPPSERAQQALRDHFFRLICGGLGERQITSVDQLKRCMAIDLDPTWPHFIGRALERLTPSYGAVSDCGTMFLRYARDVLNKRPAYFFSSEQEGVEWRERFLREALEMCVVDDGLELMQRWSNHGACVPFSDLLRVMPLVKYSADLPNIASARALMEWLLTSRRDVSAVLDAAEAEQNRVVRAGAQVAEAIDTGWFVRAFGQRAEPISAFVNASVNELLRRITMWKRTEKVLGPDKVALKVRNTDGVIEVLCSQHLGSGGSKWVAEVLRLAGPDRGMTPERRLYAYAKFPTLQGLVRAITKVEEALRDPSVTDPAHRAELEHELRIHMRAYTYNIGLVVGEVEIARSAGSDAISTWLIRSQKHPDRIKGMGMEYANGGTLLDVLAKHPLSMCSQEALSYAQLLCALIARLHQRHILHLDLKTPNVLVEYTPDGVRLKLGDFGASRMERPGDMCTLRVSSYCPPEMVDAKQHPTPFTSAMDSWSLGITVLHLVYGSWAVALMTDPSGASIRPFLYVKNVIEKLPDSNPKVTEIIEGLLDLDPRVRWSAQRAADALAGLLSKP
jgi:hypothetical protein